MANEDGTDWKEVGERAKTAAQDTLEEVRDKAGELYEEGMEKTRELRSFFEERIRDKPLQAVLIGAGVGLLLGRFRVRPLEALILAAGTGLACGTLMSGKTGRRFAREEE